MDKLIAISNRCWYNRSVRECGTYREEGCHDMNAFARTEMLLGKDSTAKLQAASVAIFGVGGVGSFAAEGLARGGVGRLILFDSDIVNESNLNRQLVALTSTIGQPKTAVMRDRILDINPNACVEAFRLHYDAQTAPSVDLSAFSYVIDAIDTVTSKLLLVEQAIAAHVPIISSMGAGNKLDPTRLEVADIYATSICPLAKVMRKELRARGVAALKVVYTREPALTPLVPEPPPPGSSRRQTPGSVPFVPSVAGLILAGEVIKDITEVVK